MKEIYSAFDKTPPESVYLFYYFKHSKNWFVGKWEIYPDDFHGGWSSSSGFCDIYDATMWTYLDEKDFKDPSTRLPIESVRVFLFLREEQKWVVGSLENGKFECRRLFEQFDKQIEDVQYWMCPELPQIPDEDDEDDQQDLCE